MPDPTSSNILLLEPTRGSDSGTWDTPVNANMSALDGIIGGQATLALSASTTITLSTPATGTVSPVAGPNQSQNGVIKLTGTLTGPIAILLTLPREYVFDNQCTVGTTYVQVRPSAGTGTAVGLPPGQKTHLWFDGINVDFIGLAHVGSYLDLAVAATPAWMTGCTNLPYLICNGTIYTSSVYPVLGAMLGSTFGGNGITTFGVPDVAGRVRLPLDTTAVRITNSGAGFNGNVMGTSGGSQLMQNHTHVANASYDVTGDTVLSGLGGSLGFAGGGSNQAAGIPSITVAVTSTGSGASQNVQPSIVFGLAFIKT